MTRAQAVAASKGGSSIPRIRIVARLKYLSWFVKTRDALRPLDIRPAGPSSHQESLMRRCLSAALLMAALFAVTGPARAVDEPAKGADRASVDAYAGTWKVVFLQGGMEQNLFIVKVTGPKIEVVSSGIPNLKDAKAEVGKSSDDTLAFTIEGTGIVPLKFTIHPPKGEKQPKKMLGSIEFRGNPFFARLERTEEKEIDPKSAMKQVEGAQDFAKARNLADTKEKEKLLKEFLEKNPDSVLAFQALLELVGVLPINGAKDDDVKATAEKAITFATAYGPELKTAAVAQVAERLVNSNKAPALAAEYAQRVEKGLPEGATAVKKLAAAKLLLSALKQGDKKDEVKEVTERIAKLDKMVDDEYLKNAVPFKTETFTRAGGKSRVALVELFTGAYCPPCVAADVAFDAALKTYKPQDVVLLQYHLHIPAPDRLTNEDTEKRSKYYPLRGVPSTYVSGGNDLGLGGSKEMGKGSYTRLMNAVKEPLDKDAGANIKLTADQKGDDIVIKAEVADLKDPGEDMKLRLVLVEEMVRYPGGNGQRFHHHVVRAMPGGADGMALKTGTEKQEVKVNLAELKKTLEEGDKKGRFMDQEHPFDLKHFKVVAFVQNDKSKEVLQAAQADVHGEK
jgi:hypothetical protein